MILFTAATPHGAGVSGAIDHWEPDGQCSMEHFIRGVSKAVDLKLGFRQPFLASCNWQAVRGWKPLVLVYPQDSRTWRKPHHLRQQVGDLKMVLWVAQPQRSFQQWRDASPHSIGTTYLPVTVSSTGGGVHNSDGSSPSSSGGSQVDQQFPEVAGQQAKARPLRQCRQAILMPKSA